MSTDLTTPIFHDEDAARAHFQALRWPHGPVCPHCGVVDNATAKTLRPIIVKTADRASYLTTDGARMYPAVGKESAAHSAVAHAAGEYVRHGLHHSNTAENYFSILKRGITGTFHHISEAHLSRYLVAFDFRYSHRAGLGITDTMRADEAVRGVVGKRLNYRQPRRAA
jgi:transposase-like protein